MRTEEDRIGIVVDEASFDSGVVDTLGNRSN